MTLTERSKFWLVVCLILVAGFLGGILGNWIFIYLLDKYYGIAAGNYAAAPAGTNIVIRQPSRQVMTAGIDVATTVEKSLVGIFKRNSTPVYPASAKLGQGVIITSDGWLVTTAALPADKSGAWNEYVVVADGRLYDIDRVVVDAPSQLSFVHLKKANSLTVREFVASRDLGSFQAVYALEWQGFLEAGLLGHSGSAARSSDTSQPELSVSGLSGRNATIFDQSGRIVGIARGRTVIAMDMIKALTNKLLTDGKIERARLGVRYVPLLASTGNSQSGVLLSGAEDAPAVITGSPADRAGLRAGDIITSLDEVQVGAEADLAALIAEYESGDTVTITYIRGSEKRQADVTLDAFTEK